MSAKEKKQPQSSHDATTPLGSVDQIRDIIFGAQMRDYEERFSALESRLMNEARTLRADVQDRFQALERNLGDEKDERGAATENLIAELRSTARSIEERSTNDLGEIHKQLAETRDAIMARLDSLQNAKTDRAALSGLLREMAAELDNESTAAADASGESG